MKLFSFTIPTLRLGKKTQNSPITGIKVADTKTRASYAIRPRPAPAISYEINDIKVATTVATAQYRPDRSRLIMLYEYIMQDSHLSSQIMVAVNKVISESFGLYKGETLDKEATKFLQSAWFELVVTYIVEAELYGYSLVEFDLDAANRTIDVTLIYRTCVQPDMKLLQLDGNINGDLVSYADAMNDLKLLQFGVPKDLGSLLKAAYNVLWKFYARSDWSRSSEKFGMPILWIKADTNQDSELDRIEQKAANFGSDGYIVTQAGDEVSIVERSGQDIHKIYLENIRYCDEQISKLIVGQTATSDTQAWAGSSNVQERVMDDISSSRMRRVKYAVNNQVLPFLVKNGFAFLNGLEFDYTIIKEPKADTTPTQPTPDKPVEIPVKKKLNRAITWVNSELHKLYFGKHEPGCGCEQHHAPVVRLSLGKKQVVASAITDIASGKNATINTELFKLYFNGFEKAVKQVFPEGVNPDLARKFKLNVAEFAAHKTYKLTQGIAECGTDAKAAQALVAKHNQYNDAELTAVTTRARTARQWEQFQTERHIYPNLQWIRSRSANPRELHLGYAGLVLPMNDPFWQSNQPGNLWNCKCDWKTTDATPADTPQATVPPATGLEGNPYETGKLITGKHPYYKTSTDEENTISKFVTKTIRDTSVQDALNNLRKMAVPQFTSYGGNVKVEIKIGLSRKGILHFAHDYHPNMDYKNLLISDLDKLVESASTGISVLNTDKLNTMVVYYHYFEVDILGEKWFLNVRENINGDFTLYALTDKIRKSV